MKTRTIARLELMAAEAETRLLEEITKHNTTLGQIDHQKRVLAEYRARLSETWRHGGVVAAGQARRAETFTSASDDAARRIDAEEVRGRGQLETALQNLARVQQRRRGLAEARRKALALAERDAERAFERALTWRAPAAPK